MVDRYGWRPGSAYQQYQTLVTDCEQVLSPEHRNTLGTRYGLAHWAGRSGWHDLAIDLFEHLIQDQLQIMTPDHPDIAATRDALTALQQS